MLLNRETELLPPEILTPHPRNARRGNVDAIAESIRRVGFYGAVIAQRSSGFVVAGNHRVRAAIAAGLEEIPVTWIDVDDETALRILLADNRSSDLATYEDGTLAELLSELALTESALAGTLYDPEDLDRLVAALAPPTPPEGFASYGEELATAYRCPKCSYEWNGKPR